MIYGPFFTIAVFIFPLGWLEELKAEGWWGGGANGSGVEGSSTGEELEHLITRVFAGPPAIVSRVSQAV